MKKPKDIKALDRKIEDFKLRNKIQSDSANAENNEYSRGAVGFQISAELLAGVLVGAGIGYLIDAFFNTAPWFLAIFTILGGAAGILSIYRTFKAENKAEE